MRCYVKKGLCMLMTVMLLMFCIAPAAVFAEDEKPTAEASDTAASDVLDNSGEMKLDVVFVLDASGSMAYSDPDKISLDAFTLFTDLLDDTCGVGYSVYTHKIEDYSNIVKLKKEGALEEMRKKISSIEYDPHGFTDISLGLTKALEIFDRQSSSKQNKHKAIILLSDGNTNLLQAGTRTNQESFEEMDKTLAELSEKKIPVYSIGLNADGTLDKAELEKISEKTSGKTYVAGNSDMLTGIAGSIFADIASVKGTELKITNGNVTVNVKDNTVFYVNVIIRTKLTDTELNPVLKDPDGNIVDIATDKNVRFTSTYSYKLLKLIYPKAGKWNLHLSKAKDDNCTITQLDYYSVYVKFIVPEKWSVSSPVKLEATLNNGSKIVDDYDLLKTIKMKVVAHCEGKEDETIPLERQPDGKYTGEFKTSDAGTYILKAIAETDTFSKESDENQITFSALSQTDDEAQENQTDFFTALKTIIIVAVIVIVVLAIIVIVISVVRSNRLKALRDQMAAPPPPPPAPRPKPAAPPQPKPAPVEKEKAPDLVDYRIVEHDKLENLVKKGGDDSFNRNASDYQSDRSLEGLIRKGQEDPFNTRAEDYKSDASLEGIIKTGGDGLNGDNNSGAVQLTKADPSLEGIVKTGGEGFDGSQMQAVEADHSLEGLIRTGGEGFDQSGSEGKVDLSKADPALASLIKTGGDGVGVGKAEEEYSDEDDGEGDGSSY